MAFLYSEAMWQLGFLILAVVGMVNAVDFVFDESLQPQVLLRGRLGVLAFSVGLVGLAVIAARAC